MSVDLDQILQEVAARYGLVLQRDDPIIGAVAINDVVLDRLLERIDDASKTHAETLEKQTERQIEASRKIAKTVIGEALNTAQTEIQRKRDQSIEEIQQATSYVAQAVQSDRTALIRQLWIAWGCATLFAGGLALVLLIG